MKKENERRNLKERKKLFTKNKCNNIISKDYNPLNKDKGFYEREGLPMEEKRDLELEEVMKELNLEEREFVEKYPKECIRLYKKGMIDCFNYYNKDGTF